MKTPDSKTAAHKREMLLRRGRSAFKELIRLHGGTLTAEKVANMLGIERTEVLQLMSDSQLLGYEQEGQMVFPAFQFAGDHLVPEFTAILSRLDTTSAIAQIRFFLTPDIDLGCSPIESLKQGKNIVLVKLRALQFGHQLAV